MLQDEVRPSDGRGRCAGAMGRGIWQGGGGHWWWWLQGLADASKQGLTQLAGGVREFLVKPDVGWLRMPALGVPAGLR